MHDKFVLRSWPHNMTERLKQMWWDGHSAAFIALTIGAANARAVADKAHRSGFIRNPESEKWREAHKIADHLVPMVREDGTLITMANVRNNECRWMYAKESSCDAPLCGRKTAPQKSWCEEHHRKCYQRVSGNAAC